MSLRMRPMDIDFLRDPGARSAAGSVLLVLGMFAASVAAAWTAALDADAGRLEAQLAETQRAARRAPGAAAASPRDTEELRVAQLVVQQMTVPWDRLFRELEGAPRSGIALLAVQPDAASRQLRISGEARHLKAMLDYSRRLQDGGMLGEVVLLGHEVKSQDPQHPVAFSLSAAWGEAR